MKQNRKPEQVAREYGFEDRFGRDIDKVLANLWLGNGPYGERGYRKVADWFNIRIIECAYEDAGVPAREYNLVDSYESLQLQDERDMDIYLQKFAEYGINTQEVVDDFVGSTTMYRYLTDVVGAEKQTGSEDPSEWSSDEIENQIEEFEVELRKALDSHYNVDFESDMDVDIVVDVSDENGTAPLTRVLDEGHVPPQQEKSTTIQFKVNTDDIIPDSIPLG